MILDAKIPAGPLAEKWSKHKFNLKLVNPANKRKYDVIVVGTGLAGASAAASLAELGYNVKAFCFQDSPRRAHSIAAQGGINAAKNYRNDGDSVYRLFYDTIKGGDYRAREANVYRLAEVSVDIIDQCVAQGVPFAREYGGLLDTRSFGGAQVSRTFYARGQTGQQLLLGAYSALNRQINEGKVKMYNRTEMLDVVVVDGKAQGIVTRNLISGEIETHSGHAVLLCTGGYGNVFYLSTNAMGCNVTAAWRAHKRGAFFGNPCYTQIHPTCIPVSGDHQSKLTLMSESLRNDGRVWAPKTTELAEKLRKGELKALDLKEEDRDYFLERKYPSFGNLVPRDIYPAVHYTMGGLWVDYNLMTTIPGLYCLGEANFSDHGANRLGASALMQGLSDGYFVIPYTLGDYLATIGPKPVDTKHPAFAQTKQDVLDRVAKLLALKGTKTVDEYHRELGLIMWEYCGMARSFEGLSKAKGLIQNLKADFWKNAIVLGENEEINSSLEKAGRVADFIELGELMVDDALMRSESCGGHFRVESQTEEGEALRDDNNFAFVAAWEYKGEGVQEVLNKEPLIFENVHLTQRSYK